MMKDAEIQFRTAFMDTNVLINLLLRNKDDKIKRKMREFISLILNWRKPINIVITNVLVSEFLYKIIKWEKSKRLITDKGYFLSEIDKEDLYKETLEKEFKERIYESLSNLFYYVINFNTSKIDRFCINKKVLNYLILDLELEFQDAFLIADLVTSLYNHNKTSLDFFFTSDKILLKKLNYLKNNIIRPYFKQNKRPDEVMKILSILKETLFINPTTDKGLRKLKEEIKKIKDIREEDRIPELDRFKRLFQFPKWHE